MAVEQCKKCGVWNCAGGDSCKSDLYDNGVDDTRAATVREVCAILPAVIDCPACQSHKDFTCGRCLTAQKKLLTETGVTP